MGIIEYKSSISGMETYTSDNPTNENHTKLAREEIFYSKKSPRRVAGILTL